jgi:4,5-dihydroxyphthalate decarboxylase
VVKDAALASHPGLATELFHLFTKAKSQYLPRLRSGAAPDRSLRKMAQTVGGDPLPYGFESSRRTLETFIRFNVDQGVIPQAVAPEDLFVPETLALV